MWILNEDAVITFCWMFMPTAHLRERGLWIWNMNDFAQRKTSPKALIRATEMRRCKNARALQPFSPNENSRSTKRIFMKLYNGEFYQPLSAYSNVLQHVSKL